MQSIQINAVNAQTGAVDASSLNVASVIIKDLKISTTSELFRTRSPARERACYLLGNRDYQLFKLFF